MYPVGLIIAQAYPGNMGAAPILGAAAALAPMYSNPQPNPETPPDTSSPLITLSRSKEPSSKHYILSSDGTLRFEMRYDLCAGLKDGDWESMNDLERQSLSAYFRSNSNPCDPLKLKLMSETTKVVQTIAQQLEHKKPNGISVKLEKVDPVIDDDNVLKITPSTAFSLIGGKTLIDKHRTSGLVAQLVAQQILAHEQKEAKLAYKHKENDLETVKAIFEANGKKVESNKAQVEKADLLTVRVPHFARGLRDHLNSLIYNCVTSLLLKNEGVSANDCYQHFKDSDTHPSHAKRVEYLTKALCDQYPNENRDICKNSKTDL